MTVYDPLKGAWEEPRRLSDWGKSCTPPLDMAWLSQINFDRNPIEVMSIGRFLLPEFVAFRGGVFLRIQHNEAGFHRWFKKLNSLSAVERMVNHIHVYDVFGYAKDATDGEFLQVATLMQRTWKIALSVSFPDDEFDVQLSDSELDYGPTVTFSKTR